MTVSCSEADVTQQAVDATFIAIRDLNGLSGSEHLAFPPYSIFNLWDTQMATFDIKPLLNTSFEQIYIARNFNLTKITGPGWPYESSIKAKMLFVQSNSITDNGFGETLNYFDPSILTYLNLGSNQLSGSRAKSKTEACGSLGVFEFLPGLSDLTKLQQIFLNNNPIVSLGGGQFASNNRIVTLDFSVLPADPKIEANAFAFYPVNATDSIINSTITIRFYANDFNDTTINMKENGLFYTQRPIYLDITANKLDHLSQESFEPFLNAHDKNKISVNNNPLICDERMKWLKDQRDKFELKVTNAFCSNDKGNTVFNTTLIQ